MWIIGNKVQFKVPMCETQRAKMALWKYPLSGFDESERRRIYTDAIYRCRLCCVKCLLWEDRLCSAWQAVHDRVMHLVVNVIFFLCFQTGGPASGRSSEDPLRQHMRILLYSAQEVQSAGLIEYVRRDRYLSFFFDFFYGCTCVLHFIFLVCGRGCPRIIMK